MNFRRRVGRLEKALNIATDVRFWRIVMRTIPGILDPSEGPEYLSGRAEEPLGLRTCDRYFMSGMVFETVWINGCEIPQDEIDRFVESFPIRGLPPNQKFRVSRAASK